ncbi:MAG: pyridoxal-dependent decarboxylase [Verrucomicrobiota bacterium]|nr:pyridoxal-dependent decarboxylase [Verrucomicrobiota bacterium]
MSPLDPSREEILRWGNETVAWMADYLSTIRDRPVYPHNTSAEIRARLDSTLAEEGVPFENLLAAFRDDIIPLSRQNGHPRMFGYVQAPGVAIAAFADLLASTLNANLTAWRSAPAAVEVERLTIDWIKQILSYPETAGGLFVSGGSMANFCALAAARRTKVPNESKKVPRLYASEETHHSVFKAATLLGIGRENCRLIGTDDNYRIRLDELAAKIEEDLRDGYQPFFIAGNAGTVATGAVDPLAQLAEVATRYNLWFHIDACYGGFAALAPSARHLFNAFPEAHSIALDPHKWLYLPADCGCILYRNPENARATFSYDAEYTRIMEQMPNESFAFWDYGPELSRRFRALKVWMLLKGVGLRAIRDAIEKDLACARHLEALVRQSNDFEMLAPVELSIFCFRYCPSGIRDNEAQLNAFNERLLIELQRDGSSYLSNASLRGRFALRGCVLNYRTTPRDMEILLDDLRRVAAKS